MLWFSYMNWFSKTLFLPQQTGRKEEKSTALPLDGVLTSPTLKLNLKQSSDRPAIFFSANSYTIDLFFFFFWTKLLKCLEIQMYWVTKLYKYSTPIPAGVPFTLSETLPHLLCLAEGKIFSFEFRPVWKRSDREGQVWKWVTFDLVASEPQWQLSFQKDLLVFLLPHVGAAVVLSPTSTWLHVLPAKGMTFSTALTSVALE